MTTYVDDRSRVDKLEPIVKRILGEHLIGTATRAADRQEATDFWVYEIHPIRIGCRLRRYKYFQNEEYRNQFTVRVSRPSGVPSEMGKIVDGWGDYIFYGFANENDTDLVKWFIGDLKVFRSCLIRNRQLLRGLYMGKNRDGSSSFYAWPVDAFPKEFILAEHRQ